MRWQIESEHSFVDALFLLYELKEERSACGAPFGRIPRRSLPALNQPTLAVSFPVAGATIEIAE